MADRYFQCAMCKKLSTQDDTDCYKNNAGTVVAGNITNEVCICTGVNRRLRSLTQAQYNMEVALNREINQ